MVHLIALALLSASVPVMAQYDAITPDPFLQVESNIQGSSYSGSEAPAKAAPPKDAATPFYLSLAPDLNGYTRFADGGSDSNWYIGFNNSWIVRLPPAPTDKFSRAFIGARIGRAKTSPDPKRPWLHKVIPGKVYMAISPRPAFSSKQSFFLAETADIPAERHATLHLKNTGHAEWFWAEVPKALVSTQEANYLIIWSPTRTFRSAAASPILAAHKPPARGAAESRAWNNHAILGVPPRTEDDSLKVPIGLLPAMAIKLIPSAGAAVHVTDFSTEGDGPALTVRFSASGKDIELGWVEMSQDELEWERISRFSRTPPHIFSIPRSLLPPRGAFLRGKARDSAADEGTSYHTFVYGEGGR